MPEEVLLERRLAAVEAAVRELQRLVSSRAPGPDWLARVTGSMRDEPAFDEVLQYGREIRQADRPPEDAVP
jgi:hypothetical protein